LRKIYVRDRNTHSSRCFSSNLSHSQSFKFTRFPYRFEKKKWLLFVFISIFKIVDNKFLMFFFTLVSSLFNITTQNSVKQSEFMIKFSPNIIDNYRQLFEEDLMFCFVLCLQWDSKRVGDNWKIWKKFNFSTFKVFFKFLKKMSEIHITSKTEVQWRRSWWIFCNHANSSLAAF
jgi:hypothetical protein